MADFKPDISAHHLVLVGDFNTLIFQPAWFAAQELIRESEAKEAKVEVIHRDIVAFSLDWLKLQITRDRFMAQSTQEPYYEMVRDFVTGTFHILEHTPIRLMGINFEYHYRLPENDKRWQSFEQTLLKSSRINSILDEGSVAGIVFRDKRTFNDVPGQATVRLEQSPRIPGVYVNTNDHYDLDKHDDKIQDATEVTAVLETQWAKSYHRSEKYARDIMEAL